MRRPEPDLVSLLFRPLNPRDHVRAAIRARLRHGLDRVRGVFLCSGSVFVGGREGHRGFGEVVEGVALVFLAGELVVREEVGVVSRVGGVGDGLGPGFVGAGGGWGVGGAVVEVAEEEEVGGGVEEGVVVGGDLGGRLGFGEERLRFAFGALLEGGAALHFSFEDEALADAFPVLVSPLPFWLHRREMRRYEREYYVLLPIALRTETEPDAHGTLVPHIPQPDSHAARFNPPYAVPCFLFGEYHDRCQAHIPDDRLVVHHFLACKLAPRRILYRLRKAIEVRRELRASKKAVADGCDLLQAEDY